MSAISLHWLTLAGHSRKSCLQ